MMAALFSLIVKQQLGNRTVLVVSGMKVCCRGAVNFKFSPVVDIDLTVPSHF